MNVSIQRDEDRSADLIPDIPGAVALAGRVFDEQYFPGAESAFVAARSLDSDLAIQQDNVLAGGRVVEIVIVGACDLAENDCSGLLYFGQETDAAFVLQRNADVFEMALAVGICVNAGDLKIFHCFYRFMTRKKPGLWGTGFAVLYLKLL
jgi:hypothetical protein